MEREPRVLGAFVKLHRETIDAAPDGLGKRVRRRLDGELIQALEATGRLSWVPLAQHQALAGALFQEAEGAVAREVCRQTVLSSFQQPFLEPLFLGAMGVLGGSLERFARWAPKAWITIFRDFGELAWQVDGPGAGRFVLADPAPALLRSPDYLEALAGGFSALFEVCKANGEVAVTPSAGEIRFNLRWEPL